MTLCLFLLCALTASAQINVNIDVTNPSCNGFTNGSATAVASGGSGSYSYSWSNGDSGQTTSGLGDGTLSVTVTDDQGATGTRSATVQAPAALSATFQQGGAQCARTSDVTVSASGGTAPYSYAWDDGQTGASASNLGFRVACVTVTDAAGCEQIFCTHVEQPLTVTLTTQDVLCAGGCDAVIIATVAGGVQPITYLWDNGTTDAINDMLTPGTYCVTVTDGAGCVVEQCATVGQPTGFQVDFTITDPTCGGTDGAVTASASGGTPPYSYSYSNGGSGASQSGLAEGTYTVTVTDANGCSGTETFTLAGSNLSVSIDPNSPPCGAGATGSATAIVTGGTAPFQYDWSSGSTSASAANLAPGMYTVTVTDANGCTGTATTTITAGNALDISVSGTDELCNGDGNGVASANVSGGTPPYTYTWSNGASDPTIDDLAPGTYTVMVSDAAGCMGAATVTIGSPDVLQCTVTTLSEISLQGANDGQITAQFSGGVPTYTVTWNTGQTGQTLSNLGPGTYTATVTDGNGCTTTCSTTLVEPVIGLGKIGDYVFRDLDRDGQQDPGEPGVNGVRVTLIYPDGTRSPFITTGTSGFYCFGDLEPGDYQVEFEIKLGDDVFTLANTGDDATDSDAIVDDKPQIGTSPVYTIRGDTILTVDAGVFDPCVPVSAGTIEATDDMVCGVGADPGIIRSVTPATSTGAIRYLWMINTSNDPNIATWGVAPGVNDQASYDPGPIYQDTYFARCAFGVNCSAPTETNRVVITTGNDARAEIDGPTSVCADEAYTFRAVSPGGGARVTWDFGPNATPRTSNASTVNVTWATFGQRNVSLTVVANGCEVSRTQRVSISNCVVRPPFPVSSRLMGDETVDLEWSMEDEDLAGVYRIDRSDDGGATFSNIGEVDVTLGAIRQVYTYSDVAPKRGYNVYRVCRVLDLGDTYFSDQASESLLTERVEMIAYPNPVTERVTLERFEYVDQDRRVELVDQAGRVLRVYNFAAGEPIIEVVLSDAPVGQLTLRMVSPEGIVGSLPILRQ